jgi:LysR family glycine cleavage system transcriptional activator
MERRYLPPLNALRAFEAAGRHLSITKAAAELCVTEPAVSQQIKQLEQHFGRRLFIRHPNGMELTTEGQHLLPVLEQCFDRVSEVAETIKKGSVHRALRVQLTPHFSAHWIGPRLDGFMNSFPDIELSIQHSYAPIDHMQPNVDIAVAWDPLNWKGAVAEPLMTLGYLPMCSPRLIGDRAISLEDLASYPLIQERGTRLWADWFEAVGTTPPKFARIIDYDNYDIAVHAAVQGQGIGILMYPMFRDLYDTGQLVAPFGTNISVPITCYLLYMQQSLLRDEVRTFRDWILREVSCDKRFGKKEGGA